MCCKTPALNRSLSCRELNEPVNNFSLVNQPEQRARWERGEPSVLGTPVSAANGRVGTAGYFGCSFVPYWPDLPEVYSYCHSNAESRGYMRIRDNDPMSPPLVQNNLLGSDADLHRVTRCVNALVNIHKQFPPRFNMSFKEPVDGVVTDEWIRGKLNTGAHFVGACPVGEVLDERLRVRGVHALRIVDSSVMRQLPVSAGPMASVMMLAEYMADMIAKLYRD
ncbi:Glucose-methanol-choline oxidoreductase [Gracilaria domingensis]|nr:Glucose-methanol-choline oxidoreductase [Gracilaria domingensis]